MKEAKKMPSIFVLFLITGTILLSCEMRSSDEKKLNAGKSDESVTIGTQVWTSKNLDVSTFRNGDTIPQASTQEEWYAASENKQPAWCNYENNLANGAKYGKLYNWYAVNDPRGLASEGWHIPTLAEWEVLDKYLVPYYAGIKMKSKAGWLANGNGTNESSFSGLPGGYRDSDGRFIDVGEFGTWWTSDEYGDDTAWYRYLYYLGNDLGRTANLRGYGFSVRCVED